MNNNTLWRKLAAKYIDRYILVNGCEFKVRQQDLQKYFGNYDKSLSIEEASNQFNFDFKESDHSQLFTLKKKNQEKL